MAVLYGEQLSVRLSPEDVELLAQWRDRNRDADGDRMSVSAAVRLFVRDRLAAEFPDAGASRKIRGRKENAGSRR